MDADRLLEAIEKGQAVLATTQGDGFGGRYVDNRKFRAWRTQTLILLESALGRDHTYTEAYDRAAEGAKPYDVEEGLGVLDGIRQDLEDGVLEPASLSAPSRETALSICEGFHRSTRQLRRRYDDRPTLDVLDEYDVQDLLHSLLVIHFDDIRPEEYTPSYAGGASRMDFLLKRERIVIEAKRSRTSLTERKLGSELIEDIARYESHPDCGELICFVYDPEGYLGNPRGLEADLSRDTGALPVTVLIRPSD